MVQEIEQDPKYSDEFCKFIKSLDSNCIVFPKYLKDNKISPRGLRHKYDLHFSAKGNRVYSDFLLEYIRNSK